MTELCAKTSAPFANHFSDNSRLSLSSYIPTSKMAAAAERRKKQNKKKEPLETHKTEERNKGKLLPFSHHSICLNNSNLYLFCSSSLSLCFFFFFPSSFRTHSSLDVRRLNPPSRKCQSSWGDSRETSRARLSIKEGFDFNGKCRKAVDRGDC